jgi:hypothetical protein
VPKPGAGNAHCGPAPRPSAMTRMHCAMAVLLAALIVAWAGVLLEVCEVNPRALCRKAAAAASAWPACGGSEWPDEATLGSFRCRKILRSLRSSCACSTSG